ncbi:MAG: hypothetical protein P4M12_01180 [Gammaproteobacteria bacterium]|nr:hypothetical protein [Gammaproteobacteria bacterium]
MKNITKIISSIVLSTCVMSSAMASQGYYGTPKAKTANAANYSQVVLHNYTPDTYMAYATFQPTGKTQNLPLGASYPYNTISYDINYPDNQVCLNVVRDFDGATVFNSCLSSGNINVGPYKSGKTPNVTVK